MRDSLVFYRSFYEAIRELPPEEFKKSVEAIMEYGLNGTEITTSGTAKAIFIMAKPQIDKNNKRYENGTKGGVKPKQNQTETKPQPKQNQIETKPQPNVNVNDNVNDNELKESIEKRHFVPPTTQDVAEYCKEKGITTVDAERFVDFYSSKGWMVGKNKMKDWKAAVRNWGRKDAAAKPNNTKGNKFTNFEQRSYDYRELEGKLLAAGKE